jgi:AraC-like DNA-binding protein
MEYIRKRRLALAGSELAFTDAKVIDVALKYGYDSPDSFAKAFTRFHGMKPALVRKDGATLKSFAPLKILRTAENQNNIRGWLSYGLQNHAKGQLHDYRRFEKV